MPVFMSGPFSLDISAVTFPLMFMSPEKTSGVGGAKRQPSTSTFNSPY